MLRKASTPFWKSGRHGGVIAVEGLRIPTERSPWAYERGAHGTASEYNRPNSRRSMEMSNGLVLRPIVKAWHLVPHDRAAIERHVQGLRLPPIVAQLLLNRGLNEAESARQFLD